MGRCLVCTGVVRPSGILVGLAETLFRFLRLDGLITISGAEFLRSYGEITFAWAMLTEDRR